MTTDRTKFCCLCGQPRKPTQKPVGEFGNNLEIVRMREYRELKDGRWEQSPQMLVSVSLRRNGGTDYGNTHICDGCIVVGLKVAKRFVDKAISELTEET